MPILKILMKENDETIFKEAAKIARGKEIVFSSGIPISTYCRIQPLCRHCEWQSNLFFQDNIEKHISKRLFSKKVLKISKIGIKRIVLSSGWQGEKLPSYFYEYIHGLTLKIQNEIWCAFGAIDKESMKKLLEIGVKGYSCGIETTNKGIFEKVRPGDNYEKRIETLEIAKELGMKTETAMVIGIGEKIDDIIEGIILMKKLDVDYAALWPFCPCPFTKMEKEEIPNSFFVCKILSLMVIYLRGKNIVGDTRPKNLKWSIRSGANVFGLSTKGDFTRITEMRNNYFKKMFK